MLMRSRLSQGVLEVELCQARGLPPNCDPSRTPLVCVFPSIIYGLVLLRSLSLSASTALVDESGFDFTCFENLPSSLESINFDFPGSTTMMSYFRDRLGNAVSQRFPRLSKLCLRGGNPLTLRDLPELPSTVTDLECDFYVDDMDLDSLSRLPRNLRRLEGKLLGEIGNNPQALALLPPLLETCRFKTDPVVDCNIRHSWIPRGVIDCRTAGPLKLEWTRTLPPSLERLDLYLRDGSDDSLAEAVSALPRGLQSFKIGMDWETRVLILAGLESAIHCLPRTLTTLETSHIIKIDLEKLLEAHKDWTKTSNGASFWPPSLKTLCLQDHFNLPEDLPLLPRTVYCLKIGVKSGTDAPLELDGTALGIIFPNLTHLFLTLASTKAHLSSPLPTSLVEMGLSSNGKCSLLPSSFPFLFTADSAIPQLHLGVTWSEETSGAPSLESMASLVRLYVNAWSCDDFHLLPRSLAEFEVFYLTETGDSPLKSQGMLFAHLPPALTRLVITGSVNKRSANRPVEPIVQSLSSIPLISELQIHSLGVFPSAMIRELPIGLQKLRMILQTIDEQDAPFIPPHCKVFQVHNQQSQMPWDMLYLAMHWPPRAILNIPIKETTMLELVAKRLFDLNN